MTEKMTKGLTIKEYRKIINDYLLSKSQYNKLTYSTKTILATLDIQGGEIIICGEQKGRLSLHSVLNGELTETIQRVLAMYKESGNDLISYYYYSYLQIYAICGEGNP